MRSDRLKAQRIRIGHSQSSFAEVIGTTQKQVWRYEEGDSRGVPTLTRPKTGCAGLHPEAYPSPLTIGQSVCW